MGILEASLVSVRVINMTLMVAGTITLGPGVGINTSIITAVNFADSYAILTGVASNSGTATPSDLGVIILLLNATTVQAFRATSVVTVTVGFQVIGHR